MRIFSLFYPPVVFFVIGLFIISVDNLPISHAAPLPKWAEAPTVQQSKTLSLRDAILRAFGRSPAIAQASAQAGIGQAQIDEAQSVWYPQVSLSGTSGHSKQADSSGSLNNSASYGLTLSQLVYDFGKTNNNIKKQETVSASYYYNLLSVMNEVGEKTALTYLDVKRYQSLCDAVEDNIKSLEAVRDMAQLRADAGLSSSSDVLQAEARIAGMRATLEQYRAQRLTAVSQLAVLTGVRASNLPDYPKELLKQPVQLDSIGYQNNPQVQSAQSQQNAAKYGVEVAKSQNWPTLSLQGARTRHETDSRSYWNDQLQLSVDMPIYQGGAVSARVDQAEGVRRAAESQVNQAKMDINQKAATAFANWTGARERETAGDQQFFAAITARDVYRNEYKLSKRSLNDLLSVEQDVHQAAIAKLNADYDGWTSAVNYAAAVDNLLPLLEILRKYKDDLPSL
ncbi:TolC family outer membrane protein [Budvicia aquatica]|uniref:Transporter n=1 Tax=Budvicia aquatica TaxID=82979 RepID=A0A2C6DLS7_9GAMM|nr:TolC family outer membrane protein [Budvicia aquatica]PHI30167.1 hypothetical protein CRN84_12865 [Budvicia aquatica]